MLVDQSLYIKYEYIRDTGLAAQVLDTLRCSVGYDGSDQGVDGAFQTLKENPMSHWLLKRCFVEKKLHLLEGTSLLSSGGQHHHWRERQYSSDLIKVLELQAIQFQDCLCTAAFPPAGLWINDELSSDDATIRAHIDSLVIPYLPKSKSKRPPMVLQDLGSFQRIATLASRVENIFSGDRHRLLMNSSGTGKTRLLYEGLCQHWGLFFTCYVDDGNLGLSDLRTTIARLTSDHWRPRNDLPLTLDSEARYLLGIAHRHCSEVLLARLLQLKVFMTAAGEEIDSIAAKRLWLCYQLQEAMVHLDLDGSSKNVITSIEDWLAENCFLDHAIRDTLTEIFALRGTSDPLFIVLDEANAARGALPPDLSRDMHSILVDILRVWKLHAADFNISFIVSGTTITRQDFDPCDPEWREFHWSSNTGDFWENRALHKQYVERLLPKQLLARPSGKSLVRRILRWLPARHRFTAAFMSELIRQNFKKPHRILNTYMYQFTDGFSLSDERRMYEKGNLSMPLWPFSILTLHGTGSYVVAAIRDAIVNRLVHNEHPMMFKQQFTGLVSEGFGRFADPEREHIVADEPILLLGCTIYFLEKSIWLSDLRDYSHRDFWFRTAFSALSVIALNLSHVLSSSQRLCDAFTFARGNRSWTTQDARLIYLKRKNSKTIPARYFYDYVPAAPTKLCTITDSPSGIVDWLSQRETTPFCLHKGTPSPTLFFLLELDDESTICVALQVSIDYYEDDNAMPAEVFRQMLRRMEPSELFGDGKTSAQRTTRAQAKAQTKSSLSDVLKTLPGGREDMGEFPLLRIVASLSGSTPAVQERLSDGSETPFGVLNVEFVGYFDTRVTSPGLGNDLAASFMHYPLNPTVKRKRVSMDDRDARETKHCRVTP